MRNVEELRVWVSKRLDGSPLLASWDVDDVLEDIMGMDGFPDWCAVGVDSDDTDWYKFLLTVSVLEIRDRIRGAEIPE